MIIISTAESARVLSELKKIRAAMAQEVLDIFRGFVTVAYINVVENTPQWTGHATAQWNIGVNQVDISQSQMYAEENLAVSHAIVGKDDEKCVPTKVVGDPEAVEEAKRRQGGVIKRIKLDDMIFISNDVESLLTGAYAAKLEANPNNYLRRENEGGHMILKTMSWFDSRLALLDSATQAKLKMVRLSASGIMETF